GFRLGQLKGGWLYGQLGYRVWLYRDHCTQNHLTLQRECRCRALGGLAGGGSGGHCRGLDGRLVGTGGGDWRFAAVQSAVCHQLLPAQLPDCQLCPGRWRVARRGFLLHVQRCGPAVGYHPVGLGVSGLRAGSLPVDFRSPGSHSGRVVSMVAGTSGETNRRKRLCLIPMWWSLPVPIGVLVWNWPGIMPPKAVKSLAYAGSRRTSSPAWRLR